MSKYKVKENEKGFVHVQIIRQEFNSLTGKPMYKSYPYICTPKEMQNFLEHPNGMSIEKVLHLPKGYEFPLKKIKKGKKTIEVQYDSLKDVEIKAEKTDDPREIRGKELKRMTVPQLDELLGYPSDENKPTKIEAILESEFSE